MDDYRCGNCHDPEPELIPVRGPLEKRADERDDEQESEALQNSLCALQNQHRAQAPAPTIIEPLEEVANDDVHCPMSSCLANCAATPCSVPLSRCHSRA